MAADLTRKIRLLIYSGHGEIVGGDAKAILELASRLNPDRFDIQLCTDENPAFAPRLEQWSSRDLEVRYLPTYPDLVSPSWSSGVQSFPRLSTRIAAYAWRFLSGQWLIGQLKNYRIFRELFREAGPIDVFLFNNGAYVGKEAGLTALLAAKNSGVPAKLMFLHNIPRKRRRPVDWAWDWILARSCDWVVTASEALKKGMAELRGYPMSRMSVIYCGVEAKAVEKGQAPFEKKPDWRYLSLVGNVIPTKGHDFLLQALSEVIKTHPGVGLVVVGGGTKDYLTSLQKMAEQLGVSKHVQFLGHRSDSDRIVQQVDVAIVPSVFAEATPYTIKEALRAGVPVITTTSGGCPEAVVDGESGIIVKPYDVPALSAAIIRLLDQPELGKSLAARGRERFLKMFEMNESVRQHERLMERLIQPFQ